MKMSSLCQICTKEPFKYRCPACDSRSMTCSQPVKRLITNRTAACSLQCSREHNVQCRGHAAVLADLATSNDTCQEATAINVSAGLSERNPVDQLATTSEIQKLFTNYPYLRGQLRSIYVASIGLSDTPGSNDTSGRGGRQRSHPRHTYSTLEKGVDRGLSKLAKDLESNGEHSPGLTAFYETVARLLEEGMPSRAAE